MPQARPDHAEAIAELALDVCDEIAEFNRRYGTSVQLRIGICTGPAVAGAIGRNRFAFDLWGDTVNLAGRLEALGKLGRVLVAASTYERLKAKYVFEQTSLADVNGGRELPAYWLCRRLSI